jgi:prevent-host-death family protein
MQTVSLRQMQHHLSEIMRRVDHGQEILVTRRRRIVARLVPAAAGASAVDWPDFAGRARALGIKGPSTARLLRAERDA